MATRFSSYFSGGGNQQVNPPATPSANTQTRFSSYFQAPQSGTSNKPLSFQTAGNIGVGSNAPQPSIQPMFNFSSFLSNTKTKIASFIDSLDDEKRREQANKRGEDLAKNIQTGLVEFGKEVLRATPRSAVSAVLTATGGKKFTPGEIPQTAGFEKFLYGEKPIRDIRGTGEETIQAFGGNRDTAIKYGLPLGFVLTGLDLYPGIPKKKIAEVIAKETNPAKIANILKTKVFKDVTDDVAEALGRRLAPVKDAKTVKLELDFFTKVDRTKLTGKALSTASEDILKGRQGILQPLAEEARKYKSAEAKIKQFVPEVRFESADDFMKGTQQVVIPDVGEVTFKTNNKDIIIYSAGNIKDVERLPFKGTGKVTKVIRSLMALAEEEGKNIHVVGATGSGYWDHLGFDAKNFMVPGLTPKDLSKIKALDEFRVTTQKGLPEGVQDVVRISPVESQAVKIQKPSEIGQKLDIPPLQKVVSADELGSRALDKSVEAKSIGKQVIEETSKQTKDPPSVVRKVLDSAKEVKTKIIEYVQNEQERVRQLVGKKGVVVDDISDPYLKATLYSGRVAEKIDQGKKEAQEIVKQAKKVADEFKSDLKTIRKEVNDYLKFRHAPERNAALGEKAAGVTTKEAVEGLKRIESSPQGARIKEIAERASKLNEQTLELLKKSGVISDELYDTLRTKYKNHVPLNRIFEETEDIGSALSGKGFDVRSTGIKRAVGSEREVDDILGNIISNYEQAVLRSEKNIVDQATLAFARNNKDIFGNLFQITRPRGIGKTFEGGIIREKTQDPTILQMFEKGKPVWIKINDKNLAIALKGVGREKLGLIMNGVARFTRLYSGLATRFNPEFALPNKIRDLQETAVYMSSQKGIGFKGAAQLAKRELAQENTKAILDYLRGTDTEGARLYKEMRQLGGTTGGFGLSTREEVRLSIGKLEKLADSKTRRIADNVIRYIDNWNTIFEDSTRLSVYRQALKQGLSKERAAFLAKEASINFNRMGKGGPIINALWMFSNASIQGSAKMVRSLRNPKVLGATLLTVGSSVSAVNQWNDRVDPDWRDKISKWDRLNGLPIILPSKEGEGVKYLTIPVSWGIKPIKVMADYAYDTASGIELDPRKFANDTMTAVLEAYNPAGGSDFWSAITPTILDIPSELSRNRAWSGNKIRPDYDQNAPADVQYFSSLKKTKTGQAAISISELLQSKTGIAISPADIRYAFDGYVGGLGRAGSKTVNTIIGALGAKPAPLDEYPMLSRFYRERTQEEVGQGAAGPTEDIKGTLSEQSRERFKLKQEAEDIYGELSKLPKDEANTRARKIKEDNPALFDKIKDIKQDADLGLNYQERLTKQLGVENGERAKYILKEAGKLKSKEEKNAYIRSLVEKKIISDKVIEQIRALKEKE